MNGGRVARRFGRGNRRSDRFRRLRLDRDGALRERRGRRDVHHRRGNRDGFGLCRVRGGHPGRLGRRRGGFRIGNQSAQPQGAEPFFDEQSDPAQVGGLLSQPSKDRRGGDHRRAPEHKQQDGAHQRGANAVALGRRYGA